MTNPPGAMPPLPEPTYIYHLNPSTGEDDLFEFASSGAVDEDCKYCKRLYTSDQLQAYAAPLIARVAELEADAARYRWLRAQHWNENTLAVVLRPKDNTKLGCFLPFDDLLDQAIDTARAALTPTKD